MPKPGYRSITVTDDIYQIAVKNAKERGLSVAGYVSLLLRSLTVNITVEGTVKRGNAQ